MEEREFASNGEIGLLVDDPDPNAFHGSPSQLHSSLAASTPPTPTTFGTTVIGKSSASRGPLSSSDEPPLSATVDFARNYVGQVEGTQQQSTTSSSNVRSLSHFAVSGESAAQAPSSVPPYTNIAVSCRICGKGEEEGRPVMRFLPVDHDPAAAAAAPSVTTFFLDIGLHVFCGKTASILSHVNRPDLEVLTKAGLKNKHGIGPEVNAALARTRCATLVQDGTKEKQYYLVREFEAHLAAIRHTSISFGTGSMSAGVVTADSYASPFLPAYGNRELHHGASQPPSTSFLFSHDHHSPLSGPSFHPAAATSDIDGGEHAASTDPLLYPANYDEQLGTTMDDDVGHVQDLDGDDNEDTERNHGDDSEPDNDYGDAPGYPIRINHETNRRRHQPPKATPVRANVGLISKHGLPRTQPRHPQPQSQLPHAYATMPYGSDTAVDGKVRCDCGGTHLPPGTARGAQSWRNHVMTKRHQKWMEDNGLLGAV